MNDLELAMMKRQGLSCYVIETACGEREWWAEDKAHAAEQHADAFGDDIDEVIISIRLT
jgi:hypothetical protein